MKLNFVAKARKPQGNCLICHGPILAGQSYKWAKPRHGSIRLFCQDCQVLPSHLTANPRLADLYSAQESISAALTEGIHADILIALRDAITTAEDTRDSYQESLDNMPEPLQAGPTGQEIQEKIDAIESWISELENAESNLEGLDPADINENTDYSEAETANSSLEL